MPETYKFRDKDNGQLYVFDWNKPVPPTDDEIDSILDQQDAMRQKNMMPVEEPSFLSRFGSEAWKTANEPLLDLDTQAMGNAIAPVDEMNSLPSALAAGAVEGIGNVAEGFTSPLSILSILASGGAAKSIADAGKLALATKSPMIAPTLLPRIATGIDAAQAGVGGVKVAEGDMSGLLDIALGGGGALAANPALRQVELNPFARAAKSAEQTRLLQVEEAAKGLELELQAAKLAEEQANLPPVEGIEGFINTVEEAPIGPYLDKIGQGNQKVPRLPKQPKQPADSKLPLFVDEEPVIPPRQLSAAERERIDFETSLREAVANSRRPEVLADVEPPIIKPLKKIADPLNYLERTGPQPPEKDFGPNGRPSGVITPEDFNVPEGPRPALLPVESIGSKPIDPEQVKIQKARFAGRKDLERQQADPPFKIMDKRNKLDDVDEVIQPVESEPIKTDIESIKVDEPIRTDVEPTKIDVEPVRIEPVAPAKVEPSDLDFDDWYQQDLPSRDGLSSMPIHQTLERYKNWAKEHGVEPDIEAFNNKLVKMWRDDHNVGLTVHDNPSSIPPEIRSVLPKREDGRPYYYWTPIKRPVRPVNTGVVSEVRGKLADSVDDIPQAPRTDLAGVEPVATKVDSAPAGTVKKKIKIGDKEVEVNSPVKTPDEDVLGEFIAKRRGKAKADTAIDLKSVYKDYVAWSKKNNHEPSLNEFKSILAKSPRFGFKTVPKDSALAGMQGEAGIRGGDAVAAQVFDLGKGQTADKGPVIKHLRKLQAQAKESEQRRKDLKSGKIKPEDKRSDRGSVIVPGQETLGKVAGKVADVLEKGKEVLKSLKPDPTGRFSRAVKPVLTIFDEIDKKKGTKLGEKSRAYMKDWEEPADHNIFRHREATQDLTDDQYTEMVRVLDTGKASSDKAVMSAAGKVRAILDDARDAAKAQDVLIGEKDVYFPHKKGNEWDHDKQIKVYDTDELPSSNLEFGRRDNRSVFEKDGYRTDRGVIDEYLNDSYRRISEAKNFGRSLENIVPNKLPKNSTQFKPKVANKLKKMLGIKEANDIQFSDATVAKIKELIKEKKKFSKDFKTQLKAEVKVTKLQEPVKFDPELADYISAAARRLTNREKHGLGSKLLAEGRHAVALTALKMSGINQAGQFAHIYSANGQLGGGRVLRAIDDLYKKGNYKASELEAIRSGSLRPSVLGELFESSGHAGKVADLPSKIGEKLHLPKKLTDKGKGFLWGIPTADKHMRLVADKVGRLLVDDAVKGDAGAIKTLKSLGFDTPKKADQKFYDSVAKKFTNDTNFRTGILDQPLWTTSTYGRVATQFTSFMYQHTRFIGNLIKKSKTDNEARKQLALFAASAILVGEGVNDIKAYFKGNGIKGENPKDMADDMIRVLGNKRHSHPLWRSVQNIAAAGGAGIFQSLIEGLMRDKKQLLIGPLGSKVAEGLEAVTETGSRIYRDKPKKLEPVGKFGLAQATTYDIANKVYPKKRAAISF